MEKFNTSGKDTFENNGEKNAIILDAKKNIHTLKNNELLELNAAQNLSKKKKEEFEKTGFVTYSDAELKIIANWGNKSFGETFNVENIAKKEIQEYIIRMELSWTIQNTELLLAGLSNTQWKKAISEYEKTHIKLRNSGRYFEYKINGLLLEGVLIQAINKTTTQAGDYPHGEHTELLKALIAQEHETNIYNDTMVHLEKIETLDDQLLALDRRQKAQILKEALQSKEGGNTMLYNKILILIHKYFDSQEIEEHFGAQIQEKITLLVDETVQGIKQHEQTHEVATQLGSNATLGLSRPTREEFYSTFRKEAIAIEKNLLKRQIVPDNSSVPYDIMKLRIPGSNEKIVQIENYSPLKEFFDKKLLGEGEKFVLLEIKEGNTLSKDSFGIAKIDPQNAKITVRDLAGKQINEISEKQYNEMVNAYTQATDVIYTEKTKKSLEQTQQTFSSFQGAQKLIEKMSTAKIDWENSNIVTGLFYGILSASTYGYSSIGKIGLNMNIKVKEGLSQTDYQQIITHVQGLQKTIESIDINKIKASKQEIDAFIKESNGLDSNYEKSLKDASSALDYIIQGIEKDGFKEFIAFAKNTRHVTDNNTLTKLIENRITNNGLKIVMGLATAAAVITALPSGGGSLLGLSALGAGSFMVGARTGQAINEKIQNDYFEQTITVGGENIALHFNDPTDVEQFLKAKQAGDKKTMNALIAQAGTEFVSLTAMSYGIGRVVTFLNPKIAKFVARNPSNPAAILIKKVKPSFSALHPTASELLGKQVLTSGTKNGFFKNFSKHFISEGVEESAEGAAETIGNASGIPGLGVAMAIIVGISGKGQFNNLMQKQKIAIKSIGEDGMITLSHQGDQRIIENYYLNQGFTINEQGILTKHTGHQGLETISIKLENTTNAYSLRVSGLMQEFAMEASNETGNYTLKGDAKTQELFQMQAQKYYKVIPGKNGVKLIGGNDIISIAFEQQTNIATIDYATIKSPKQFEEIFSAFETSANTITSENKKTLIESTKSLSDYLSSLPGKMFSATIKNIQERYTTLLSTLEKNIKEFGETYEIVTLSGDKIGTTLGFGNLPILIRKKRGKYAPYRKISGLTELTQQVHNEGHFINEKNKSIDAVKFDQIIEELKTHMRDSKNYTSEGIEVIIETKLGVKHHKMKQKIIKSLDKEINNELTQTYASLDKTKRKFAISVNNTLGKNISIELLEKIYTCKTSIESLNYKEHTDTIDDAIIKLLQEKSESVAWAGDVGKLISGGVLGKHIKESFDIDGLDKRLNGPGRVALRLDKVRLRKKTIMAGISVPYFGLSRYYGLKIQGLALKGIKVSEMLSNTIKNNMSEIEGNAQDLAEKAQDIAQTGEKTAQSLETLKETINSINDIGLNKVADALTGGEFSKRIDALNTTSEVSQKGLNEMTKFLESISLDNGFTTEMLSKLVPLLDRAGTIIHTGILFNEIVSAAALAGTLYLVSGRYKKIKFTKEMTQEEYKKTLLRSLGTFTLLSILAVLYLELKLHVSEQADKGNSDLNGVLMMIEQAVPAVKEVNYEDIEK